MRIEELRPASERAIVELEEDVKVLPSGLEIVRDNAGKNYQPSEDFETGHVIAVGDHEAFYPVAVGDRVIVRAPSGGAAGADIGHAFGRNRGELIIVEHTEIMAVIGE